MIKKSSWNSVKEKLNSWFFLYSILVICLGFVTYFINFQNPQAPFWDENYHVSASQKYQEGVFFLELHPPLGKLLIAAGDAVLDVNDLSDEEAQKMVSVDKVEDFPDDYNFTGVRFVPSLMAFLASYLVFLSFYLIFKNSHFSFAFTSLYLFNNAFIVHFRSAMLDGIQMFFILAAITYFLFSIQKPKVKLWDIAGLTALVALAVATKINGLILAVLVLSLGLKYAFSVTFFNSLKKLLQRSLSQSDLKNTAVKLSKVLLVAPLISISIFVSIFVGIQAVHFYLARDIAGDKTYDISSQFEERVKKGEYNLGYVLHGTVESLRYSDQYNVGVPKLNEGNPRENGSYPTDWLVGRKAISYRWDRYVVSKDQHNTYNPLIRPATDVSISDYNNSGSLREQYVLVTRYVYLQVNPIVWLLSLLGIVLFLALIIYSLLFRPENFKNTEILLGLPFAVMYIGYFVTVLQVDRVLYLYHSFIPIVFGFYMLALVFRYWLHNTPYQVFKNPKTNYYLVGVVTALVFASYLIFAPFTYHMPMTNDEFDSRKWLTFWELRSSTEQENLPKD